jgi:ribosomal subunit interface protein
MQVIISARHFDVSDALRGLVEERFSRLDRFEERIGRVEVTLLEGWRKRTAMRSRVI